jgi:hypothetical protein
VRVLSGLKKSRSTGSVKIKEWFAKKSETEVR